MKTDPYAFIINVMEGAKNDLRVEAKRLNPLLGATINVLPVVFGIYGALWVSGFRDADRRWILLVCLWGIMFSWILAGILVCRFMRASEATVEDMSLRRRVLRVACMVSLMLVIGLVLRITT